MKRIPLLILLFSFQCLFAQNEDLRLWYREPAKKWTDALPVGNGRLGAMVYGGTATELIQFNEETLWTGEPRSYDRAGAHQHLNELRSLLFLGRQKEAEQLAEKEFMGLKSNEGQRAEWTARMRRDTSFAAATYDDRSWKDWSVPSYEGWEAQGLEGMDGAVWFRTSFQMPAEGVMKNWVLDLNRVGNQDFTYINGVLIGTQESNDGRKYVVPAGVLRPGTNSIAVQVLNYTDKGGILGYKDASRAIGLYPAGRESEKISLSGNWKMQVVDTKPPAVARYQADYQPFGNLKLLFDNRPVTAYRRELDLRTAIATTSYVQDGIRYTREVYASAPDNAIVIHLKADKPTSLNFGGALSTPHSSNQPVSIDARTAGLDLAVRNGALRGRCLLRIVPRNGSVSVRGNEFLVQNADEVTLYLLAATNFRNYADVSADPALLTRAMLQKISGRSEPTVRAAHLKEYRSYFDRFSLRFPGTAYVQLPTDERIAAFAKSNDPSFVALYAQYGRYLLIASSRPGTRPANLQGIWNELLSPPWGSKYTTNINAEMNYWPAELFNLSPMHEPLFEMIGELAERGKVTAREYYNAPGWVVHHNTDLWRGTSPINAANHGIWVGGSGWLSRHLWEHYLFTQDLEFLRRKAYPLMKEAARFYQAYLVADPRTGYLVSGPSNSPEQGGLVMGPTMDHQIIRELFASVIDAANLLHTDENFRKELASLLSRLAPNRVGRYGQLQEWMEDKDDTASRHRHVSHLWGVYPGNEINWDTSETMMKAARQSLLYRGDAATGWSLGWKINLWARFRDGEHTYKLIQMLLSPAEKGGAGSYHNLFDAHPPFQIDGNFGGAAGIGEMILQSHTDYIDLLPALPQALADGSVKGICARGGFVVDMDWQNGQPKTIRVRSLAGKPLRLRFRGKEIKVPTQKGKIYSFNGSLFHP